jgi:hypothetical protein
MTAASTDGAMAMRSPLRHKWVKVERSIVQTCANCGLRKIARWSHNQHWTEWQHRDGRYIDSEGTPPCGS